MLHADVSWVDQPRKSLEIHLLRWFSTFYHEKSQFNHHVGNRYFFSNHLKQIKVLTLWFCPILKNCWIFRINPTSSEVEVEKDWMAIRSCNMSSGVVTINEVLIQSSYDMYLQKEWKKHHSLFFKDALPGCSIFVLESPFWKTKCWVKPENKSFCMHMFFSWGSWCLFSINVPGSTDEWWNKEIGLGQEDESKDIIEVHVAYDTWTKTHILPMTTFACVYSLCKKSCSRWCCWMEVHTN